MRNFKSPVGCKVGDTCVYKHTANSADEQSKKQQPMQFTLRWMMNARWNHTKYSRMTVLNFEWDFRHLANRYVLGSGNLHFGVIQTVSENQRDPNSPSFGENIHRMDHRTRTCIKIEVRILRINIDSCPACNVFSPSIVTSKESEVILNSGALHHMMRISDLTPIISHQDKQKHRM